MTKILVIEDDHNSRGAIIECLQLEGYETISAKDGLAGLQLAQKELPDLIICDIMMPKLDGYQLLQSLRKSPVAGSIPFIFLTAKSAKKSIRQGMELGADDYLTKPYSPNELINTVETQLKKQSTRMKQMDALCKNITMALPHELRTPLTTLFAVGQILSDEGNEEMGEIILKSSERLEQLVEEYLTYAELITTNKKDIEDLLTESLASPNEIIMAIAYEKAMLVGRESDVTFSLEGQGRIWVTVDCLNAIVSHLVGNAFKFSEVTTPVSISTRTDGNQFILEISDHGWGMTSEQINGIGAYIQFDRHYHEQQGLGLGLAIVQRLAELYGLQLEIESIPNQQTTVKVVFNVV